MKFTTIAAATALLAVSLATNAAEPAATEAASAPTEPAPAATDPNCLQETGSRIKRDANQPCIGAAGQVITREQLDRSGAVTTADAMRRLSPSVH